MDLIDKARDLIHILHWRLTWARRDTHGGFTLPDNPRFMGPRDAVRLIPDGAVVANSGLGGNQRASILYWAIRETFLETGHPRDLTVMSIGGHGGRGRVPGTLEELGVEGLCRRFVTGHMETFKSFLALGDAGKVELQVLPQGTMALVLDAQGRGEDSLWLRTGVGTVLDPRVGRGSPLNDPRAEPLITAEGDGLRYRLPPVEVALFNLPAADRKGNLYATGAAMVGEAREIARAARRHGGKVIANVGLLVEEGHDEVFLPAEMVDAVVLHPGTEQTASIPHRRHWAQFTTRSDVPVEVGIERLRFFNQVLGITPRRTAVDDVLARLAASVFAAHGRRGMRVNIGVGLPEEVCRLIFEGGLLEDVTLMTESGVSGGLPAPGIFFGAAVNPRTITSSAEVFKLWNERLDVTCLGLLQADAHGNVNVSRRGEGARNYVGPGGFIDLTAAARMIVFVGSWMANGDVELEGGRMRIRKAGTPKFVDHVDEVTFSGPEALRQGKSVFYCTNVGVFRLTGRGMELAQVMPGIDVERDVLRGPMKVVLPADGKVPVVGEDVVTGRGFRLELRGEPVPGAARKAPEVEAEPV
jgi:propionate CoA-transferase